MAERALKLAEILISILERLPQRDLLFAQRVSVYWRDTIRNSKTLRQALFLEPKTTWGPEMDEDEITRYNPLLLRRFPGFFSRGTYPPGHELSERCLGPWYTSHWAESLRPWPTRFMHDAPPKYPQLDARRADAYKRPEASWRRMIPCNPAIRELQVSHLELTQPEGPFQLQLKGKVACWLFGRPHSDHLAQTSTSDSWLTFGMLYNIIEAAWFDQAPRRWPSLDIIYPPVPASLQRSVYNGQLPDEKACGAGTLYVRFCAYYYPRDYTKPYRGQFKADERFVEPADERYKI